MPQPILQCRGLYDKGNHEHKYWGVLSGFWRRWSYVNLCSQQCCPQRGQHNFCLGIPFSSKVEFILLKMTSAVPHLVPLVVHIPRKRWTTWSFIKKQKNKWSDVKKKTPPVSLWFFVQTPHLTINFITSRIPLFLFSLPPLLWLYLLSMLFPLLQSKA